MHRLRPQDETILIADADVAVLDNLRSNLQTAGYKVMEATSGLEVLTTAARDRPDLIIMDTVLRDTHGLEVCCRLQEGISTRQIPVMFLAARGQGNDVLEAFSAGACEYMTKPFAPAEVVSRVHAYFRRARRDREANPLTGLPGGPEITAELTARIARKRLFAFLWVDLGSFKAFNDYYGFLRGDQAIHLLARTVEETVQCLGNPDDFLGHVGGDDFVVITTPDKARAVCSRIIASFDERIPSLYDKADARRGFIQAENRQGEMVRHPLMTVSIGGVTNERRRIDSYLKASSVAAEVLRHAKSIPGSSYYFDQRENGVSRKAPVSPPARKTTASREQAQTMKTGEFVSIIAHELRTPVTAMQTSLEELLQLVPAEQNPHHRELLELSCRRARRLAETVSELSTYDQIERGNLNLSLRTVDLNHLVERAVKEFRWLAEEKGITLQASVPDSAPGIMLDHGKLSQVLGHLVQNALKFSTPGGTVTINVTADESEFRIEVSDTGMGIPQRELANVFQSFSHIDTPSSTRAPGLGLGLYLAKKLVRAMGGRIEVQSQERKGSTFAAVLPRNWRSGDARVKSLQDAALAAQDRLHALLQGLSHDLQAKGSVTPSADESIKALRSGISEMELITIQALLLADQANRQSECQK